VTKLICVRRIVGWEEVGEGGFDREIAVIYAAFTANIGIRSAGTSSAKTDSVRSQVDSMAWGSLPRSSHADI